MQLNHRDILDMESRYRATFINSLAGFRQVTLIGTQSLEGVNNLAIFNSLLHIGAHPPLNGLIVRPDTVQRDTLRNILDTRVYTINYVSGHDYKKAHQTSAKYPSSVSEFEATGFTPEFHEGCRAPFVKEAVVSIAMQLEDRINIDINNTILIIGSIQAVSIRDNIVSGDGFVALEKSNTLCCTGLDAYYEARFINRLKYARVDEEPTII